MNNDHKQQLLLYLINELQYPKLHMRFHKYKRKIYFHMLKKLCSMSLEEFQIYLNKFNSKLRNRYDFFFYNMYGIRALILDPKYDDCVYHYYPSSLFSMEKIFQMENLNANTIKLQRHIKFKKKKLKITMIYIYETKIILDYLCLRNLL